jgi:hypothetical protein
LLVRLAQLKEKARGRTGRDFPIIAIQDPMGRWTAAEPVGE